MAVVSNARAVAQLLMLFGSREPEGPSEQKMREQAAGWRGWLCGAATRTRSARLRNMRQGRVKRSYRLLDFDLKPLEAKHWKRLPTDGASVADA